MKLKLKNSDNFIYYPTFNDDDFFKKIYSKKEFNDYKMIEKNQPIEELCNPSEFKLLPQQKFLKNYISIETPYNGVLVFHGLGSGKTCTAIGIAEQFKDYVKKYKKRVLIILKKNIQKNFIKDIHDINKDFEKKRKDEIVQCTGNTYSLSSEDKYLTKSQKKRKIQTIIKQYYQIMGYEKFANDVLRKIKWDGNDKNLTPEIIKKIDKEYSNRIIIIDEVHHINIKFNTDIKKVPPILMTIIKYAKNIKLILMSATPMYDKPEEIIYLLNLFLLNDRREPIQMTDVFDKKSNITENGEKILTNMCKGYISYVRGVNPITFPVRLYSQESEIPLIKYDINGIELSEDDQIKSLKLVLCKMSEFQYKYYQSILSKTHNIDENSINELNILDENNITIHNSKKEIGLRNLIYASNIIYPTKTGKIVLAKNGIRGSDDGNGAFYRVLQTIDKKKRIIFKYQSHVLFDKGTKNETPFLSIDKITTYSTKFYHIIKNAINSNGIIFIYSRYLPSGLIPLALALEQNGIQRYEDNNDKQLLQYSPNINGGGGKNKPLCYLCGKDMNDNNHKANSDNYHKWYSAKYILLTGDKYLTKIDIGKAMELINNKNNEYGQQIKIIIGNEAISEGIDFHRIRQVHIIEPWYNLSSIEQIIGRAIRNCSHKTLKPEERNVEIFLYASVSPNNDNTESIDERNYRLSEKKDIKIKNIERILKQNAIDCYLNKPNNIIQTSKEIDIITSSGHKIKYNLSDKPYSRECDYKENCNYKCAWEGNVKINTDTYNLFFAKTDMEDFKKYIKKMYKKNIIYILDDIEKYVKEYIPNLDNIYLYKALDDLIKNKEIIYDKYNREGYLIYKGQYYIFQPSEISDEKIPLYYRDLPLYTKTKTIMLSSHIQDIKNFDPINENIFNTLIDKINNIYSILQEILRYNNVDDTLANYIILCIILDRININDITIILKLLISKNNKGNSLNILEQNILNYYNDLIFSDNTLINIKKKNYDIIGFKLNKKYYCINNGNWSICDESIQKKIDILERIRNNKKKNHKNMNNIMGIITYNKKNDVIFQLFDNRRYVKTITSKLQSSRRSEITGRTCETYDLNLLNDLFDELKIKRIDNKSKKEYICIVLEFFLRLRNITDEKTWFINMNLL